MGDTGQFYPPRAGLSKSFRGIRTGSRAVLNRQVTVGRSVQYSLQLFLSAVVPSLGFALAGSRKGAWVALAGYLLSAFCVLAFLGYWFASLAWGAMVGIHSLGTIYFLNRHPELRIRALKLAAAVSVIVALFSYVYMPGMRLMGTVAFPYRTPEGLVVIDLRAAVEVLRRDDVVAYRVPTVALPPGYAMGNGAGVGRVLAVEGDVIRFEREKVFVNEVAQPSQDGMPEMGEMVVAAGHCFIWTPLLRTDRSYGVTFALSKEVSMVPEANIIGKAFDRWFGRKQKYEPVQ